MFSPRLQVVTCSSVSGLHRMAYHEWGDPDNTEIVLCVHGLARTGRDFDALANVLASTYRVICPDVAGRGLSDWFVNPALYAVPQYVSDMVTLIARLQPSRLHWIGTSMGGLIGMVYASALARAQRGTASQTLAQRHTTLPLSNLRLDSIVLNDVGPHLEPASLERIGQYVGEAVQFSSFEEAVAYVRETCVTFGPHSASQWADLTRYTYIEREGQWIKHYDLGLAATFRQLSPELVAHNERLLWEAFDSISVPIQIIRGEFSDLLSRQTCEKMLQIQSDARFFQASGVGHAPTLMDAEQIAVIVEFLGSTGNQPLMI